MIDYWRRDRPAEALPEDLSDDALPEDGILRAELLEELARALERLPDELTQIIQVIMPLSYPSKAKGMPAQ